MIRNWGSKVLIVAAMALIPATAAAVPIHGLPNATEIGSSEIYLEVGQKKTASGSGINLEARNSFAKVIYFNPSAAQRDNLRFGVFGGCWSSTGGYDANGPAGCSNTNARNTQFIAYPSRPDGTVKTTCGKVFDGELMSANSWVDRGVNFTGGCEIEANLEHSRPGTPAYVMYIRAYFETTTDVPSPLGRINAFKLRSCQLSTSCTPMGRMTYMDQDDFTKFVAAGFIASDAFFAVQRRTGSAPSGGDDMSFEFGTVCAFARAANYNTNAVNRALTWSDADHNAASVPGNPPNPGIGWRLYEKPFGAAGLGTEVTNEFTPDDIGGNNQDKAKAYNFKPLHEYTWRWQNVLKENGLQLRMPFDGLTALLACPAEIKANKLMQNGSAVPAAVAGATFTMKQSTATRTSTANPAYFSSLSGQVSGAPAVPAVNIAAAAPNGYKVTGWRACDQTATPNCNPNSGAYPFTATNNRTFTPAAGHRYAYAFYYEAQPAALVQHKIFAANGIDMLKDYVRDNENLTFDVLSYVFPDAGFRSVGGPNPRLWLAGIWCDGVGVPGCKDPAGSDNSKNADINVVTSINNSAEVDCPGSACRERVPLAYVPQDDGSGIDGSTTPGGNNWLSIRLEAFGVGYNSRLGGIASNDNSNLGGHIGNYIRQTEVSNIRTEVSNIETTFGKPDKGTSYQGKHSSDNAIQADVRVTTNLPAGSQNDPAVGGGGSAGIWDNVRNPKSDPSSFDDPIGVGIADLANVGGSPSNFTFPTSIGAVTARLSGAVVAEDGSITSLLQDGKGNGYRNPTEPLTLSGAVTSADVSLKWDEYVNWSQVDDKGHWYPTSTSGVATGFELGTYTNPHYETLHYYSGGSVGSPAYVNTTYYYYCYNPSTNTYTYPPSNTTGTIPPATPPNQCYHWYQVNNYNYSMTCQTTGPTFAGNSFGFASWSTPNSQSQYGWVNTDAVQNQSIPKGSHGQTQLSHFTGPNGSTNPAWSNTGSVDYWQDTNITAMSNAGSTNKPAHTRRWIYNTTDPLYTNRMIYSGNSSTSYSNGYYVGGTTSHCYYNGAGSGGSPATDVSYSQYVGGYYSNPKYLYENSATPTTPYYGLYGNPATFDGNSNGTVDTGWAWLTNKQRVQYEQTYPGHTRELGSRVMAPVGTACLTGATDTRADQIFFGLSSITGNAADCWALAGRDSALIYNPTISVAGGDVFSGRNLSSYFSSSSGSAFTFENGVISHFNSAVNFPDYYLNPDNPNKTRSRNDYCLRTASGAECDPSSNPASYVFKDFAALKAKGVANGGPSTGSLGGKVYYVGGDLNLNDTQFCGGAGTVIVEGNLNITGGGTSYCAYGGSDKKQVPSVGFIVLGNIHVAPSVTNIVGSYFANGFFDSGSYLLNGGNVSDDGSLSPNDDRITNDARLNVSGLVIANSFYLLRQPSGAELRINSNAESFNYDGRVVVNTPPGYSDIFSASAVWNETVPLN